MNTVMATVRGLLLAATTPNTSSDPFMFNREGNYAEEVQYELGSLAPNCTSPTLILFSIDRCTSHRQSAVACNFTYLG